MLKALAGSSWGQDEDTLLLTYNALGKYISSCAAPIWSTNANDSIFKKIQTARNASLRRETGDTQLPLERSPKILVVIMHPSLSFHKHCNYVTDRKNKRNNMLKALAGSSWDRTRIRYC